MPNMQPSTHRQRCAWVTADPLYQRYHDREWGVPLHDDRLLFEVLILEGVQAGLNWLTVLQKRDNYRSAFADFNPQQVAQYDDAKIATLLADSGLIRHRLKMRAAVTNAQAVVAIQGEFGSFDRYIWQFVGGTPIVNSWSTSSEVPTETLVSQTMSRDLKKRGFQFVGPTICYAFMQAGGLVNDHTTDCFCHARVVMA